ncbi:MAG: hypothetical protein WBG13_01365, partial [Pseudolabrys sp.]
IGQNPDTDDVYERDEINNRPPLTVADAGENSGYRDSQDHNEKIKISQCQMLSDPMFQLPQARTPLNVQ